MRTVQAGLVVAMLVAIGCGNSAPETVDLTPVQNEITSHAETLTAAKDLPQAREAVARHDGEMARVMADLRKNISRVIGEGCTCNAMRASGSGWTWSPVDAIPGEVTLHRGNIDACPDLDRVRVEQERYGAMMTSYIATAHADLSTMRCGGMMGSGHMNGGMMGR